MTNTAEIVIIGGGVHGCSLAFHLAQETNLARMLREDLAEARNQWIKEAKDNPQEYSQRQQSDFLADVNHEGEIFDFHCLRHTCGAWLAMPSIPYGTFRKTRTRVSEWLPRSHS